jgi:peptidoglycan/LPS O-acetylase OafA/YrhL
MDYLGVVACALAAVLALSSVGFIAPRLGVELASDRYATIDGLRGFAAFFVFLCHAATWFYYAKTGRWANAPIRLYGNLGQASVVVFFMITAFLFITKLLQARASGLDWLRLFVSRVMRLLPLYLFAMGVMVLVVSIVSGFAWKENAGHFFAALGQWLLFTTWGAPDLNGVADTWLIIAGVTWSLPYEWFFYLLLPLLALVVGTAVPRLLTVVTAVLALGLMWDALTPMYAAPFLGGAFAAALVRRPAFLAWAQRKRATVFALLTLAMALTLFWGSLKTLPILLISLTFAVVAGGNSLFGVLTSRAARLLGEVSYSMYLLHGIFMFSLVHWVIGVDALATMSPLVYWSIVLVAAPVLVSICVLTFACIERPAMDSVQRVTASIRRTGARARLSS